MNHFKSGAPEPAQQITCSECGTVFPFTAAEQRFYEERGLASPPKRCKACRQARRAQQGQSGPPSRPFRPRDSGPPRSEGRAPPRYERRPASFTRDAGPESRPRASRPAFQRAEWGSAPSHGEAPREAGGPASSEAPPSAPAESRPRSRPERPRFDITCAQCGAPAQVPFKPLEGRQVFCQPCYRARKGAGVPPEAPPEDRDSGIVE